MTTIKNGADSRRTELEQCCRKLKVAETKCGSLKSKINYMKMYCQIKTDKTKVEPIIETITDNSQEHNLIPENSKTDGNISLCDSNVSVLTNQNYFNFVQENENFEEKIQGNNEMNMCNEKVSKVEETEKLYRVLDSISVCSTLKSTTHKTKEEEEGKEKEEFFENMICDDKKQEIEYMTQKNIFSFKEPNEQLIINNPTEWTSQISSFASPDINLQKLRLNISSNIKNSQTSKCRSLIKKNKESAINAISIDKKQSTCKGDQTFNNKMKKRRGKLRNINSKSTVATKELNLTVRKDVKKRKQKDHRTNHQLSEQYVPSSKLQHNWNGVVELYHNAAMKNDSISAVSSKLEMKKINKRLNNGQYNIHIKLPHIYNQSQNYQDHQTNQYHNDNKLPPTSEEITTVKDQYAYKPTQNVGKIEIPNNEPKLYQQQNTIFDLACYVPMANRNYEMPTLASKLKRTNRSYFNRFNFRNIPFVVGTSITPSHNLGLNIQQVLSIMKTRQPNTTGITPLLIRKVSRGLEPVSTLMNQMVVEMGNDHHIVSILETKGSYDGQSSSKFIKQSPTIQPQVKPQIIAQSETNSFINPNNIQKQKIQAGRESIKNYYSPVKNTSTKFTSKWNFQNYPQTMHSVSKKEQNMVDSIKSNFKSNMQLSESKGIKEVLMNLHDQFETMNVKYDNLRKEAESSDDQSLMNEIVTLEKELNSKEEEINALISLYKEVMTLKQQMKILQQRNSFLCIDTKVPATDKMYSSTPVDLNKTSKNCTRDAMHVFNMKRQTITNTPRKVSTSMKLAGLLRQIQMFQKQLKLTS
ncbi:PREDICTED: uncharacterized protein LOC106792079 isoform X1 [Polistes canadensis]|uniref:uncharacterized protein LOC106792079 isoform X1 n=2 Tax=Polistes canadensis TaxID=91411 RepID=UPI000718E637|nr:PREDICTED: uncharacterized protein LOC106792079 isoform X1 [Polistes canadensis]XP_014613694.1 PREDICTED: uncharacterized protein LOC106792079 isoform X1 [Polistes canadensis]XP_014613695.1 PREDICTED: uncharacterized protein LOC106792079 isoform X1 [Polistes canadensis]XP_014613696.1 PREDICTED: uncharacterized protein LOC106792079 isoform X1 [Polistes canadensis]